MGRNGKRVKIVGSHYENHSINIKERSSHKEGRAVIRTRGAELSGQNYGAHHGQGGPSSPNDEEKKA